MCVAYNFWFDTNDLFFLFALFSLSSLISAPGPLDF